jgi:hypothetical protein
MGRKGVSKRKPKKSGSVSVNERSPVKSLVTDKGAPLNREGSTPSAGSNNTKKKR